VIGGEDCLHIVFSGTLNPSMLPYRTTAVTASRPPLYYCKSTDTGENCIKNTRNISVPVSQCKEHMKSMCLFVQFNFGGIFHKTLLNSYHATLNLLTET